MGLETGAPAEPDGTWDATTAEYRPGFGKALAVGVGVLGLAAIVTGLVTNASAMVPFIAPILLAALLAWAAYWRPAVIVTPAGVELRNVTRTIELPWPAIQRIDTKFALTLYTAFGAYSAWAAPAPGRNAASAASRETTGNLPESSYAGQTIGLGDLANSPSGSAAILIRTRWEKLRDAGLLDNPRLERDRPRVHWHVATLVGIAVLGAASVLIPLLRRHLGG